MRPPAGSCSQHAPPPFLEITLARPFFPHIRLSCLSTRRPPFARLSAWVGFTTHDRKRCQIMARITALIYNWWTIFMRLGIPDKHAEAITSRPLALHGIARRIRHSNQTTVEVTSTHSKAPVIAAALSKVSAFLKRIKASAEQLTQTDRWRLILSAAFQNFLRGKVLGSTGRLAEDTG